MKIKRFRTRDAFQVPGTNTMDNGFGYARDFSHGDFAVEEGARGIVVAHLKSEADPVMVPWANVLFVEYDRKDPEMAKMLGGSAKK